ncbi:sulfite exporter TauE/SafE family protein [Sphaerochaeta halotolerans]|uniref:sulfite exporter TauE/SafE family protein n=1 Tax=Sphaerochaeta halotolerans TaxID=2293840 RepID=UPI00136E72E3|nr:sulfite exporter TauE/SafE family protein [Sphaerochaeta halotolerans]MXI87720.1 TSUP family transporter [Sphaerochaeta halotolerans]
MEIILVILTFAATVIGAISGIGGGVIIKPAMDALVDFPIATISFLSGSTVLAMTAVSLLRSRKDTISVDPLVGTPLALGGAIGGVAGKMVFSWVKAAAGNNALIGMIQNIIMVVLTATVFIYVLEKARIHTLQVTSKGVAGLLGFVLGVFSSFLGIGGGPINIMFLSYFFSMDSKHAALNSLYIIFFSQVANFLTNVIQGTFPEFNMLLLVSMMVTGIVGAMVGRSLTKRLANEQVDRLFMGVMLLIVFLSAFNVWKFASL